MIVSSSATSAIAGNSSEIHSPLWPRCLNSQSFLPQQADLAEEHVGLFRRWAAAGRDTLPAPACSRTNRGGSARRTGRCGSTRLALAGWCGGGSAASPRQRRRRTPAGRVPTGSASAAPPRPGGGPGEESAPIDRLIAVAGLRRRLRHGVQSRQYCRAGGRSIDIQETHCC